MLKLYSFEIELLPKGKISLIKLFYGCLASILNVQMKSLSKTGKIKFTQMSCSV